LPELSNLFGGEWPSTAAASVVNITAMAAGATPLSRIIQRSLRETPDKAVRGEGIRLYLASGKVVIDGSGGAAVACIGHGNQRRPACDSAWHLSLPAALLNAPASSLSAVEQRSAAMATGRVGRVKPVSGKPKPHRRASPTQQSRRATL